MDGRIILFTGKGGSGKTVSAAATALRAVAHGYRTLVVSSDAAHSLADVLDTPLGPEPKEIAKNLFAQEVDLYYSMKKNWADLREVMLLIFRFQGVKRVAAEELAAIPGMGEAATLLWIDQYYTRNEYDVVVIDSAPTGETLTFLTLPQLTEWWITKAFPLQKLFFKTLGGTVRATTGIPVDKAYDQIQDMFARLGRVNKVLTNPDISSTRIVMNPERMVIQEAKRAYTYLQMYGYGVDSAIVNRVMADDGTQDESWKKYLEAQRRYLADVEASFAPLPIKHVPHLHQEVLGMELLEQIGSVLYGDRNPVDVFHKEQNYRVTSDEKAYVLEIHLPFLESGEMTVEQFGDQLVLQVKNQRRNYLLPSFLQFYRKTRASVEGKWLKVRFEPNDRK